jgi:L-malate glycosyltransferase
MKSVLFVGNFLSVHNASMPVSEFVAEMMRREGCAIQKVSDAPNRYVRLLNILYSTLIEDYSILHIDVFSGNSFWFARLAAAIGKIRQKKIILSLHGGGLHRHYEGRESAFTTLFNQTNLQTPSLFLKEFFEGRRFAVNYCPNPILLNKFPYQRRAVRPYSILWVRAFADIYNPKMPVLVLKDVLQHFPDATLTMIGPDKGLMTETQELIHRLKLERQVEVLGPVSNDKLSVYYQTHAVYLNTPSYESFGVAVVEAACCGVPVVSFKVGEIPYIWTDNENILLADMGDVGQMADSVTRIFSDGALEHRLSLNARKRAEKFSWDRIKAYWLDLLK